MINRGKFVGEIPQKQSHCAVLGVLCLLRSVQMPIEPNIN